MKIGDLVRIRTVYDPVNKDIVGKVGVVRLKGDYADRVWLIYVGGTTVWLNEDRMEVINESR